MMVIYFVLNVVSVRWFGIAEFYIGIFKILLALGLIAYTFVTMVGGNPKHDAYGFRYWNNPGAFAEHLVSGSSGRLCGVLASIVQAGFTICGPEYLSMIAAETHNPRAVLRRAFKTFIVRVSLFFIGGALCISIVIPYNDPTLARLHDEGVSTGAASPYVISMERLGIAGLGSVINAGVMISLLSAGNALLFSATRTLHGMAVDGKAPKVFSHCTKNGIPIWALLAALSLCLLALLQISETSAQVMDYLVILITANQLLNHFSVSLTYIHFYRALRAQGIDRNTLPYKGKFQPYTSYLAVVATALLTLLLGFDLFVDIQKNWSIKYFFLDYAMLLFYGIMFVGWKVFKRSSFIPPSEVDLNLGETKNEIDTYEISVKHQANVPHSAFTMATFSLIARCIWTWVQKRPFLSIFVAAIALAVSYGLIKAHRNLIASPLRAVPGPRFFALTRWRLAYEDYRGTRTHCINSLHKKYGDVVRVGPNELSFNSLFALKSIYGAGNRKKLLNHAYSKTAVLSSQNAAMIEGKTRQFLSLLDRETKSGVMEIFNALHYFSMDSITQFLYGESQGATTALTASASRNLLNDIIDPARRKLSWFTVHFPHLTHWLYSRSGAMEWLLTTFGLLPMSKPSTYTGIRRHALVAAVHIRDQTIEDPTESIAARLFHAMRTQKKGPVMDYLDVASECADHFLAGIDTTSDTLMFAIFALSQPANIPFQEKLCQEIQALPDEVIVDDVVNALAADKLHYLDAVIKETLRLYAPLPGSEPRWSEKDEVVDGYHVPARTIVSMSPYCLHRNERVFEDPVKFNPDRWLGPSEQVGEMKKWFWAFSSGGRMCIGMQ
ncbi:amino acid permease-domain-containing protein [Aspergillus floccosus]